MKRFFTIMLLTFGILNVDAQELTIDFEEFGLSPGVFLNGNDGTTEFEFGSQLMTLPIYYDTMFNAWTGWAISSMTDTETPGLSNQYSAITGSGVSGSATYATSYNYVPNSLNLAQSFYPNEIKEIRGIYITNSTYTYLSMRDGDMFAKKFGGADGNDPDFFLLTIKGLNLEMEQDSVELYLADYRFEDNTEDYLLDEWTYVDLSGFRTGQSLTFKLTSSDSGVYGVNTPQYFCIDNVEFELSSSTEDESFANLNIFPNPANDIISIDFEEEGKYKIINNNGKVVLANSITNSQIDISDLNSGIYNLIVTTNKGNATRRFVKS